MICDFCSNEHTRFCYTTSQAIATVTEDLSLGLGYDERWAACETCAEIIDRRDKEALIKRALSTIPVPADMLTPEFLKFTEDQLRLLYDGFFAVLNSVRKMCLEEAEREPRAPEIIPITFIFPELQ